MSKYSLSVIIPTYNRRKLLEFTLDSLARQTASRDDFEVIIVDDGSTDDTKEAVLRYAGSLDVKYYFQEDKGYRPGSARNIGILNTKGDICFFVDSGIILHSGCIKEHLIKHSEATGRIALIGYVYGFDQNDIGEDEIGKLILPGQPDTTIENLKAARIGLDVREKYYRKYNDRIEDLPAPWLYFWTCNVSVRRNDIMRAGPFDENYDGRWGCEDNDLGLRLWMDGVNICLCRGAESVHLPHGKNAELKKAQGYSNCEYFHAKFGTYATALFLEKYKQLVTDESVDINELILTAQFADPQTSSFQFR